MKRLLVLATTAWALLSAGPVQAQFLVENLGRGVVALRTAESSVYVGWRLLGTDPAGIAFNLYRLYSLMHDPQYRLAIAWQNVAYNQPPHPSFFLDEGMSDPPEPDIEHADTGAPAFSRLAPSIDTIWPPNHQMVAVSIDAAAIDLLDPQPTVRVVSVSSNEPVDGDDDGSTSPDWEITGPLTVNLRAERSGTGTGRVYTIVVEARDASGNTTERSAKVEVPISKQ